VSRHFSASERDVGDLLGLADIEFGGRAGAVLAHDHLPCTLVPGVMKNCPPVSGLEGIEQWAVPSS